MVNLHTGVLVIQQAKLIALENANWAKDVHHVSIIFDFMGYIRGGWMLTSLVQLISNKMVLVSIFTCACLNGSQ